MAYLSAADVIPQKLTTRRPLVQEATAYTCPTGMQVRITSADLVNDSLSAVSVSLSLVPSGQSVGPSNRILTSYSIAPGDAVSVSGLIGRLLSAGDFVSVVVSADSAVTLELYGTVARAAATPLAPIARALLAGVPTTGQYLVPINTGSTSTAAFSTAGQIMYIPVVVLVPQAFTGLGCQLSVQAVGATSPLAIMGLYANSALNRPTGSPISGTAVSFNPTTQATGAVDLAFSGGDMLLAAGTYWIAFGLTFTSTFSTPPTFVTVSSVPGNNVLASLGNTSSKLWATTGATAGTLPNSITPAQGSGSVPMVGLKAA